MSISGSQCAAMSLTVTGCTDRRMFFRGARKIPVRRSGKGRSRSNFEGFQRLLHGMARAHLQAAHVSYADWSDTMKKKIAVVVIGGTLLTGATAGAHHSFPATYSVNRTIRIEGKVTQLLLRNPHSFLQIEAPDVSGQM